MLMDLHPFEFFAIIQNLFLETLRIIQKYRDQWQYDNSAKAHS